MMKSRNILQPFVGLALILWLGIGSLVPAAYSLSTRARIAAVPDVRLVESTGSRERENDFSSPLSAVGGSKKPTKGASKAAAGSLAVKLGDFPLSFVENRGQVDGHVAYYLQGSDTYVYFSTQGVTVALPSPKEESIANPLPSSVSSLPPAVSSVLQAKPSGQGPVVHLDFIDANPLVKPQGEEQSPTVMNFFKGKKEQWRTGARSYARVVYPNLWPGIDLVYAGNGPQLKYTFMVKPGADPQRIKLAYRGACKVKLNDHGQLDVETSAGGFHDDIPVAYQEIKGQRVEVSSSYKLAAAASDRQDFGFNLGAYNRKQLLVLDPPTLVYAGYVGGSINDPALDIAVDAAGDAYITGATSSLDFPGATAYHGGNSDVFIARINAAGTGLVYSNTFGGSGDDLGLGIAVDIGGNAYVTGATSSFDFPLLIGPPGSNGGGGSIGDAFLAKFDAQGTLVRSGVFGHVGEDLGMDVAVDTAGNAYITGMTNSEIFPVTVGPDLTYNGGFWDAFVAKVSADGTEFVYCGFLGGAGSDKGLGIAVDAQGNAYVTGSTDSDQSTFPVSGGPGLIYKGGLDAFVAKINPTGTAITYAGYIGGERNDVGTRIAVDVAGNAFVTGGTSSLESSFPVTVGPSLIYNGDVLELFGDAFVAKVKPDGTGLVYCGYIGGAGGDTGTGIAVDADGNAYVSGCTTSTAATFPIIGTLGSTYKGGTIFGDAFVARVKASGTGLDYSGYIGGAGDDMATGIALDSNGNAYITGGTISSHTSFPVTLGPGTTFMGKQDAFVAKIGNQAPTAAPASVRGRITDGNGTAVGGVTINLSGNLSGGSTRTTITDSNGNYQFDNLDPGSFYTATPGLANYHFNPTSRSFSLVATRTDAGFTAQADASQGANAIDSAEYFVRQQYLDFLGREPDPGGFDFWIAQFDHCNGDSACILRKRIDVSAAFFMSGEFQETGSYVYDMYAGLLGRTPGYGEFTSDRIQVVGGSGLDAAKTAYARNFVQRGEFTTRYPAGLSREEFVDAVGQTMQQRSRIDPSSLRNGLLTDYDSGGRALVALHAAESDQFVSAEYNRAFVLMEYFGYLRRGEDGDGYQFWLNVLNQGSGNNYRGMVCSFLTSAEYQHRFNPVVSHTNGECD